MPVRYRLEYFLLLAVRAMVLALPLGAARRLGASIGSAAYKIAGSRREVALDNLRHAFPGKPEAELETIARGSFRNYGIALFELLWFPRMTPERLRANIHPMNLEVMRKGHARGKGMVMLSGHFGNWELIAFGIAHLSGYPFTIIVQTQSNPLADACINRHRTLLGNTVVPMGMAVREIIRTLSRGGVVAIAPDQSGPMEGVFVEFFGREAASHQGPAVFALRSGAVLQIGFMIRQPDWTYDVIIEEIPTDDLHGASDENVLELTRRHTAVLERYIRKYPDHWLWMHRRWKHLREPAAAVNEHPA